MNRAASQLGKMAAGVPKKFSAEEIAKRTARLRKAQKERAKTQRALRARKGYARKRQNHKLCNQNGWCFWAGQLLLIEKLEASLAKQNGDYPTGAIRRKHRGVRL